MMLLSEHHQKTNSVSSVDPGFQEVFASPRQDVLKVLYFTVFLLLNVMLNLATVILIFAMLFTS